MYSFFQHTLTVPRSGCCSGIRTPFANTRHLAYTHIPWIVTYSQANLNVWRSTKMCLLQRARSGTCPYEHGCLRFVWEWLSSYWPLACASPGCKQTNWSCARMRMKWWWICFTLHHLIPIKTTVRMVYSKWYVETGVFTRRLIKSTVKRNPASKTKQKVRKVQCTFSADTLIRPWRMQRSKDPKKILYNIEKVYHWVGVEANLAEAQAR